MLNQHSRDQILESSHVWYTTLGEGYDFFKECMNDTDYESLSEEALNALEIPSWLTEAKAEIINKEVSDFQAKELKRLSYSVQIS